MTFPRSTNPHKTTKDLRKTRYRTQTSCSLTSLSKIIIILCMILSTLSIIYPLPHDCQHRRADYDRWTPAADAHRTSSSLPSPRTQQLGAHVSFLLRYTLATHPRGHWACVCVCVCVSFGVLPGASMPPRWSDKQKKSSVFFCSIGCRRRFTPVGRCQRRGARRPPVNRQMRPGFYTSQAHRSN